MHVPLCAGFFRSAAQQAPGSPVLIGGADGDGDIAKPCQLFQPFVDLAEVARC